MMKNNSATLERETETAHPQPATDKDREAAAKLKAAGVSACTQGSRFTDAQVQEVVRRLLKNL